MIDQVKIDKLHDIIRCVVANPHNAREVAEEIAKDWYPMMQVNPDGSFDFVVSSGTKR